jgi:predicted glycosyltransferase
MKKLTVVAYAVNGSGLGHLTRVLAILRWVRRLARLGGVAPEIFVLTSSEAAGLALEEGFAAFKVPSKTAIREAGLPKEDTLRLLRQWVWHSLNLLRPSLLLVDTFPGGSFGELFHALDGPGSKVFVYRSMRESFARQEVVQALLPLYDRILLPQEPGEAPRAVEPAWAQKARRVGPILLRGREELHTREEARRRLGLPAEKKAVWLSAGGGGDPGAERWLSSLVELLSQDARLHLVIGAGPLYRGAPLRGPNITWLTSFFAAEDFLGLDAAFSAAGYNSYHELLHAGVPTAFYAQEKIADEQSRRAESAARAGAALFLSNAEDGLPGAEEVRAALEVLLDEEKARALSVAARALVPENCAREAAAEVLRPVMGRPALDAALELGTPEFFQALAARGVELGLAEEMLGCVSSDGITQAERRAWFLALLAELPDPAARALRWFGVLAKRFLPPRAASEALELRVAGASVVSRLHSFEDDRGALSFLRLLPSERGLSPEALSASLVPFLSRLSAQSESLYRGLAVLGRHLGPPGSERPLVPALEAALRDLG